MYSIYIYSRSIYIYKSIIRKRPTYNIWAESLRTSTTCKHGIIIGIIVGIIVP